MADLDGTFHGFHKLFLREGLQTSIDDRLMQLSLHFDVFSPDACGVDIGESDDV